MALGSTQSLTEMGTRGISWGKGGRCLRLTTLPPSCTVVTKSGNLIFLEPSGPVQACNGTALPLHVSSNSVLIIRTSNCINTASGIVFSASDWEVPSQPAHQTVKVSDWEVPSQPAHRTVKVSDLEVPSQPAHRTVKVSDWEVPSQPAHRTVKLSDWEVPSQPAHRTVKVTEKFPLNLHTGRSRWLRSSLSTCTPDGQGDWEVPSQPAHRTVTYREYYTRCCINTIWSPDDEHRVARNM